MPSWPMLIQGGIFGLIATALCLFPSNLSAQSETLIFRENFEGNFPQDRGWVVSDQETGGAPAYWNDVTLPGFGTPVPRGSFKVGYCAGVGHYGTTSEPYYQAEMKGSMSRTVDLRTFTSATLRFWHTVPSIDLGLDRCVVTVNDQVVYESSQTFGWTLTTLDLTPYVGTQPRIAFVFFSNKIWEAEGWYLDDIEVTGAGGGPVAAQIVRGPYLQNATTSNMVVRWRTDRAVESRVRYGLTPTTSLQVVDAGFRTEHEVTLNNLTANTRYYYSIADGTNVLAGGADHFFYTSPAQPKPTRIWVLGDSGTAGYSSAPLWVRDAYYSFAGTRYTDVWLMLGDNAYGSGTDSEYETAVFDVYQTMLRQSPLWSTLGNHETYAPKPGGGLAYMDIFNLPADGRAGGIPSGTENYYSFNYGNIHFVCLDSELSDKNPGSAMLTWLEEDLSNNTNEWLIAFWHSPPYTKGSHNSDSISDTGGNLVYMRQNVLPILEEYGVDLVLCGHSHSYERSFLLRGHYGFSSSFDPSSMVLDGGSGRVGDTGAYTKSPDEGNPGTVYVVAGSSGQVSGGSLNHRAMFVSLNLLGSLVIDIDGPRLDASFLRETGVFDDAFTIVKTSSLGIEQFKIKEGQVTLVFRSVAGGTYQLERSPDLISAKWTAFGGDIVAESSTTEVRFAVHPASANQGFYRVARVR